MSVDIWFQSLYT